MAKDQKTSFLKHANGFCTWHVYDSKAKVDLWSTIIADAHRLVIVDPAPLSLKAINEVMKMGTPVVILATNGNHERDTARFRSILNIPFGTSPGAVPHMEALKPEIIIDPSQRLYNLKFIPIKGAGAGEYALYHAVSKSLVFGDALINMDETGLSILPDKYCEDPKQLRDSLKELLDVNFDSLFFAHGQPILSGAKAIFQSIIQL